MSFFFDDPGLYFIVSNEEDSISYQSACNHITYTTKMISPIHFAFRKIKFVKNGSQQPNNDLSYSFWDYSIDSINSFSNSFKNNSPEDLVAIVYGYNQLARDEINELLGTDFIGDIFMFEIDTLKNIKKENAPSHIEN